MKAGDDAGVLKFALVVVVLRSRGEVDVEVVVVLAVSLASRDLIGGKS